MKYSVDEWPFGHRLALEGAFGLASQQDAERIRVYNTLYMIASLSRSLHASTSRMLSGKERGYLVL